MGMYASATLPLSVTATAAPPGAATAAAAVAAVGCGLGSDSPAGDDKVTGLRGTRGAVNILMERAWSAPLQANDDDGLKESLERMTCGGGDATEGAAMEALESDALCGGGANVKDPFHTLV